MHDIAAAFEEVRQRIARAAARAGRDEHDVTLVAVSKTRTVDEVRRAVEAGARHLGENYVQEMVEKYEALGDGAEPQVIWHAIGHLQRNKVRYIAPFCGVVHSLDSTRLADEIGARALQAGRVQPVLIEVNIAGEDTKFGVKPSDTAALAQHAVTVPGLELQGLMAMTPYAATADEARGHFAAARDLAQRLARDLPEGSMRHLSMGMTQDFETAVEQGATLVRVGTAIFGRREDA